MSFTSPRFAWDDQYDGEPMFTTSDRIDWKEPSKLKWSDQLARSTPKELAWDQSLPESTLKLLPWSPRGGPLAMTYSPSVRGSPRPVNASSITPNKGQQRARPTPTTSDVLLDAKTHYEVLGVNVDASQEEIKRAYKAAALRCHPDLCRGSDEEKELAKMKFQRVGEAFAVLGDARSRAKFDDMQRAKPSPAATRPSAPSHPTSTPSFRARPAPNFFNEPQTQMDPFALFNQIFGDLPGAFLGSQGSQNQYARGPGGGRPSSDAGPPPYSHSPIDQSSDNFKDGSGFPPALQAPYKFQRGKPVHLHESHSSAHLNRHGELSYQKSEKVLHVKKNGSMTFQSHSFSGNVGLESMDMMHNLMSSFGFGGPFDQRAGHPMHVQSFSAFEDSHPRTARDGGRGIGPGPGLLDSTPWNLARSSGTRARRVSSSGTSPWENSLASNWSDSSHLSSPRAENGDLQKWGF